MKKNPTLDEYLEDTSGFEDDLYGFTDYDDDVSLDVIRYFVNNCDDPAVGNYLQESYKQLLIEIGFDKPLNRDLIKTCQQVVIQESWKLAQVNLGKLDFDSLDTITK